jgi:hypothetical protein
MAARGATMPFVAPNRTRENRPKSWSELRARVLSDGYLTLAELEERRRKSHMLKVYAAIELPLVAACILLLALVGHVFVWVDIAAGALGCYGSYSLYRIGVRWERRWDELIRDRSAVAD